MSETEAGETIPNVEEEWEELQECHAENVLATEGHPDIVQFGNDVDISLVSTRMNFDIGKITGKFNISSGQGSTILWVKDIWVGKALVEFRGVHEDEEMMVHL